VFPVTLDGPRVSLREWHPDDAAAIFAYVSNPTVSAYVPWRAHADIEETKAGLAALLELATTEERSTYDLAAVLAIDHGTALVGGGRICVRSTRHRCGELSYVVHPDWWSRGLGTEIACLLIGFAFTSLGLHRVEATTHPDNVASQRVLEKAGMTYEGRMRDHLLVDGTWRDSLGYAILQTDPRPPLSNVKTSSH
jgi:[ribosomal protein S5]-alanine N-acetyltransferase